MRWGTAFSVGAACLAPYPLPTPHFVHAGTMPRM